MIGLTAACLSTIPTCVRVGFNANATTPAPPAGAATCRRLENRHARHGVYLCDRKDFSFTRHNNGLPARSFHALSVISPIVTEPRDSRSVDRSAGTRRVIVQEVIKTIGVLQYEQFGLTNCVLFNGVLCLSGISARSAILCETAEEGASP